jgi:hypothetical protein
VLIALTATVAAKEAWKKYENRRFGFVLYYPASLIKGQEAQNGGGCEFHSQDNEFSVAGMAHFFAPDSGDSFEQRWKDELEATDATVTYKRKTDDWYVVSGVTNKGYEYYHKLFVKGANWTAFHITYPHASSQKYDPWVAEIAKRFIPFQKGDYDRLEN